MAKEFLGLLCIAYLDAQLLLYFLNFFILTLESSYFYPLNSLPQCTEGRVSKKLCGAELSSSTKTQYLVTLA